MKKKLPYVVVLIAAFCFFLNTYHIDAETLEITFKSIIDFDWDKNLLEIASVFPGGEMKRYKPEQKTLSSYKIPAVFTDLNIEGILEFHQNEEYIEKKSGLNFTIRRIIISNASENEQEKRFEELCSYIKSMHQMVFTTSNPKYYDIEFAIDPLSRHRWPTIRLKKNALSKNRLEIVITQSGRAN